MKVDVCLLINESQQLWDIASPRVYTNLYGIRAEKMDA